MDKKLKVAAAIVVTKSKMTNEAKLQVLKFINTEATESQLKALLLDGEIVVLDEQAEDIVNARFDVSERIKKFIEAASAKINDIQNKISGSKK